MESWEEEKKCDGPSSSSSPSSSDVSEASVKPHPDIFPKKYFEVGESETLSKKNDIGNVVSSRQIENELKSRKMKRRKMNFKSLLLLLVEIFILVSFALYQFMATVEYMTNEYFLPMIELQRWTQAKMSRSGTYYQRSCDAEDQTTFDPKDLIVKTDDVDTIVDNMNRHGVQVIPNILSEATATELREFVLEQNKKNENMIGVISNSHRWSFYVQVDQHPSVAKALSELLSNEGLLDILEGLTGQRDPALTELVVITSEYGATDQYWHSDVSPTGSALKYSRNFVPVYSMFIPLQNTTRAMGATGFCPGSHFCPVDRCNETGFLVVEESDIWQVGWGALMNTQTAHKGSSHSDPFGPPRVLLIPSFAARPLDSSRKQIEARVIPHGSVYGTYWTHWGHTVSDFRTALTSMQQPWRTLRSLRFYSLRSFRSWDFWDQALNRLAVNEVTLDEFIEFTDKNFPLFPNFLFGNRNDGDIVEGKETDTLKNFLVETLINCRVFFSGLYWATICFYTILVLFQWRTSKGILRLCGLIGLNILIFYSISKFKHEVSSSDWAHHIRTGRMFNIPKFVSQLPTLPSTLPLRDDILMTDHMQSRYMGAYTRIIDEIHPGNVEWKKNIVPRYSVDFFKMGASYQSDVCFFLRRLIGTSKRRLLSKTAQGNWGVQTSSAFQRFCHQELTVASNDFVKAAVQELDYLRTETMFGYWRETTCHRKFIPHLLLNLKDKVLHFTSKESSLNNFEEANALILPKSMIPVLPFRSRTVLPKRRAFRFESEVEEQEPYDGAWLEEGDAIETYYKDADDYWYPGVLLSASADRYKYAVVYESGEVERNIPAKNIRRFRTFSLRERIEVDISRNEEFDYQVGYIIEIDTEGTLLKVILEESQSVVMVSLENIRRETERTAAARIAAEILDDDEEDD